MEIEFYINKITRTETVDDKAIKYFLKAKGVEDIDIQLTAKFSENVPSLWKRILGKAYGDECLIIIEDTGARQATLTAQTVEEEPETA